MALSAVYVTNAPGGIITQSSINAGVQAIVRVPVDTGYGDIVAFHWGPTLQLERAYTTAAFPNYTWVIDIASDFPIAESLSDGSYIVDYSITDFVGNETTSPATDITVEGSDISNPVYLAPVVNTTPSNIVNQATWQAGFTVTVPAQAAIIAGDVITLYSRINGVATVIGTATAAAGATTVDVAASTPAFTGINGVTGFFYYTDTRSGALLGTSSSQQVYIDVVPPPGNLTHT
ncbi:hypothetical protein ABK905_22880 [Acerihabitans sp. KWT182]|uniref:Uncharacterized protein n=1 Tax=Acerihabitans sp. KWT182 TaxID=3157919 RepID=A0AAU7Q988_9GAMM